MIGVPQVPERSDDAAIAKSSDRLDVLENGIGFCRIVGVDNQTVPTRATVELFNPFLSKTTSQRISDVLISAPSWDSNTCVNIVHAPGAVHLLHRMGGGIYVLGNAVKWDNDIFNVHASNANLTSLNPGLFGIFAKGDVVLASATRSARKFLRIATSGLFVGRLLAYISRRPQTRSSDGHTHELDFVE